MLLMSTSTGGRGGASVMEIAIDKFPLMGAKIISNFSLPNFNDNFSEDGILDQQLQKAFLKSIEKFEKVF